MEKMKRWGLPAVIALFACAVGVMCLAASAGMSDTFVYSNTALAETAIQNDEMEIAPYANAGNSVQRHANGQSGRTATTALIAEVSMISGIDPEQLPFVPVCGMLLFIVAYAFARFLFDNRVIAGCIAFLVSIEPVVLSLSYSVYLQGWAYLLMFGFMLAFLRAMEEGRSTADRLRALGFCIAALAGISFIYYSATVYALGFAGVVIFMGLISGKSISSTNKMYQMPIIIFVAISLTAFFVFDPVASGFITGLEGKVATASGVLSDYASRFAGGGAQSGTTVSGGSIPDGSRAYIGIALYVLLMTPIAALILWSAMKRCRRDKLRAPLNQAFVALVFVLCLDLLLYLMVGTLSFKMILLLAPFASVYAFSKMAKRMPTANVRMEPRKVLAVFIFALLLLVSMKSAVYLGAPSDKRIESSVQSTEWLMSMDSAPTTTLSDMIAAEKIFMHQTTFGIVDGISTAFDPYTAYIFYKNNITLANKTLNQHSIEYVVITWANVEHGLGGTNWMGGTAFGDVDRVFGKYPFLDLVYMDSYCLIYKFNSGFGVEP
jgi:hypothetical protein